MKILSIDIGIKNLSFCLFAFPDNNKQELQILQWDNITLLTTEKTIVSKCACNKPAKFTKQHLLYCGKHAPTKQRLQQKLKKQATKEVLKKFAEDNRISVSASNSKEQLFNIIQNHVNEHFFVPLSPVKKMKAADANLIDIGRNIKTHFDSLGFTDLDKVIIENQIGPIANKMKTIQGMIAQYFIMKNSLIEIEFVSATNKLKDFMETDNYKQRKKLGTDICSDMMQKDNRFSEWSSFLLSHKKKDDLSDSFLQGMWYIKHKI
jgi:hypothetical protein